MNAGFDRGTAIGRLAITTGLFLVSARILAQATGTTTGDIRGRVLDESGAAVAGVTVTAVSRESGLVRSDLTFPDGAFAIRLLPPGLYRLTASREGFRTAALDDVRVALGSSTPIELRLEIGVVTESVAVTARAGLIDPASSDLGKTIGEEKIRNLPINQRNFIEFSLTTPGVVGDRGPQPGAAPSSGLSFNGQSPRYNNILVDGLDNNDPAVGSIRTTFSQDAVEEYQVIQTPFAAEYGRAAGGIVNIVTHSGSNDLHGSAFYFYRDDSLAAHNFLTGGKTPYNQDQYGATIGGPVVRERLFYFGAAERLAVTDANVVTISDDTVGAIRRSGFDVENGDVPFERSRNTWLLKLDWQRSSRHSFSLRGTYADEEDENQQRWGGLVARSGGGVRRIEDSAIAATGVSILSEMVSNEFRALYSRREQRLDSLDPTGGVAVEIQGFATFGTNQLLPQPRDLTTYQAFDAVSLFGSRGTYKFGLDYLHTDVEGRLPLYFSGLYVFSDLPAIPGLLPAPISALEAFEAGIPAGFAQGFGDPAAKISANQLGAFAQGEWNLTERLLLRLGLRYDYEDPVDPFPTDSDNWAPRLSFSWAGGRTWRVRGGIGRFYGVVSFAPSVLAAIENGSRAKVVSRSIEVVGAPSPLEPWTLPNHRFANEAEAGASVVPLTIYRAGRFESVYSDHAGLGWEKELGGGTLLNLDYIRVRGRKILVERNVNPVVNGSRPDPSFSEIFLYESSGKSWYDAVTIGARTRPGSRLDLAAYYTYADAEDDSIDWSEGQPEDPLNIGGERGPTIHVPRHRAQLSGSYSSPESGAWWKRGWILAIIADHTAGLPYNELAGFDRNKNGDFPPSDRPEGVGRNRRTLPSATTVDLRVSRRFRLGRATIEGIVEAFNVFNRENVLEVNGVRYRDPSLEPNPDFGRATRTSDPRRIQIGGRVSF
ncbi:MAG TPA: TonB-dependent receptor [Thermoanaerobaculia bacterium]|nr:TonB-dependent receptor [Thermoanaerobaculia bacterium]